MKGASINKTREPPWRAMEKRHPLWWLAPPPLPKGKHVTGFSGRFAPLHPLLSPTHWIFGSLPLPYESSSLVQLQFLCHPPLSSVGRQKESALMGRLGALLRSTCTSYAGCAQCPYGCSALCHMTLRESVERFYSPPP